ncbi:MAG: sulfate ABC transporter permease subunit CysW [Spirochaetaceae bacterium]|jgi:sulfate transport system permease protein|nr:sulfate ABC transporter permease subunit CysW [Spirochaetaceae bacterium]
MSNQPSAYMPPAYMPPSREPPSREPRWIKPALIAFTLLFLSVFVFIPLATIFKEALSGGIKTYIQAMSDPDVFASIRLTLFTALLCVPVNTFFGVLTAWAVTKFDFRFKHTLITLIEIPFAISPVVAGLLFIFLFGSFGWFGSYLIEHNIKIVFAVPGIVIATAFVTFPFVARELIPLMRELGRDDEEAAMTLGARGLRIFFNITLPNIKWGLLYGVILTNARAVGEFGAVAVVSGSIRGLTTTMPLYIDILYGEYMFAAAFAVASLLTILALVTLFVKTIIERVLAEQRKRALV